MLKATLHAQGDSSGAGLDDDRKGYVSWLDANSPAAVGLETFVKLRMPARNACCEPLQKQAQWEQRERPQKPRCSRGQSVR